jgi:hypothetical protein
MAFWSIVGALLSVGVAWYAAWRHWDSIWANAYKAGTEVIPHGRDSVPWPYATPALWPPTASDCHVGDANPTWAEQSRTYTSSGDRPYGEMYFSMSVVDLGWPLPSMRVVFWHTSGGSGSAFWKVHFPSPRSWDYVCLPLLPIWSGFAMDSFLFGISARLVSQVVPAIRRRRRRTTNRCVTCGYDRRGLSAHSPCPECGRS